MSYWSRSRRHEGRGWGGFAPYVPVAQRRADAEKQRAKLLKKGETLHPVTLAGFSIATKWWGKSWCKNLERYADFSNRIGRGRSYVRNGMVLDLRIAPGVVTALVQGSRPQPYKVNVKVAPLSASARAQVEESCRGQLGSLSDLLAGQFPKALESLFMTEGTGLFPAPRDIQFDCTCPDWASMCKHVAAVLYGIGARFDEDPGLFFALRGIDPAKLIGGVVKQRADELLSKAKRASKKVLADADLGAVFGIELTTPDTPAQSPAPASARNTPAAPRPAASRKAKAKVSTSLPSPPAKRNRRENGVIPPPVASPEGPPSPVDAPGTKQERLLALMKTHARDEHAVRWSQLAGWKESTTRNTLAGLMAKGFVTCPARGRYRA